jgi:hypothetical protein
MGKGSAPRPYSVSAEDFSSRWDAIFSKKGIQNDDVQKETSGPNGAPEVASEQERWNDSSGNRTLPSDDKPSQ